MHENLTNDELRVYRILEGLRGSESLTGSQIMERLMIKDRRYFHQLIFNERCSRNDFLGSAATNE